MLLHQALSSKEQDPDDWDTYCLFLYNNLAITLYDQDKARDARDLQERVIEKASDWYDVGDPASDILQRNLK